MKKASDVRKTEYKTNRTVGATLLIVGGMLAIHLFWRTIDVNHLMPTVGSIATVAACVFLFLKIR